jgi:hypothetical protein
MLKPGSLRAAIDAAIPLFVTDPDRLKVWVNEGRIVARRTEALSFEYRYELHLLAEAVELAPDDILVPLLFWLRDHQPDLFLRFQADASAIQFAANILDATTWDIAIVVELTEAVAVTAHLDGSGYDVVHLPEPSPDDPLLDGALADRPLAGLSANDTPILP